VEAAKRLHLRSFETNLFSKFSTRSRLGPFTSDVALPGWDLKDVRGERRTKLADKHDLIAIDSHHADSARVAHNIAHHFFAVGCSELSFADRDHNAVMYDALSNKCEARIRSRSKLGHESAVAGASAAMDGS